VLTEASGDGTAVVFLMPLPDGPPRVLEGSAALIWIVAADGEEEIADAVAGAFGQTAAEIADDVASYLSYLVASQLLVEVTAS
jgi:hypothetical protein